MALGTEISRFANKICGGLIRKCWSGHYLVVDAKSGHQAVIIRRTDVASLAKVKPEAPADQVQRFERKLREVKQAMASLPGEEYHAELLKVVRSAGWTTLAEGIFFERSSNRFWAIPVICNNFMHGSRQPSRPFRENSGSIVWRDG